LREAARWGGRAPPRLPLKKSVSFHVNVYKHFNQDRHLIDRKTCKQHRLAASVE
jgi:hypothetical protein